ncbi:hypothetical protein [Calidifontibacter indicus]|uniref:hypothetical protein n=1 Tax=Calidifontibacter indicus TaxID=419650 RepID=UPI003D70CA91
MLQTFARPDPLMERAFTDEVRRLRDATEDAGRVRLSVDSGAAGAVIARLNDIGVRTLTCTPPSLEELFLSAYAS